MKYSVVHKTSEMAAPEETTTTNEERATMNTLIKTSASLAAIAAGMSLMPVLPATAHATAGPIYGMHGVPLWGGWGNFMMGPVPMILLVVALITLAVLGVRWFGGSSQTSTRPTAPEILRERYARGEIDREEYHAQKREIEQ